MKKYEDTTVNVLAAEVAKVFGGEHVELDPDGGYYEAFARVVVPPVVSGENRFTIPGYELNLRISTYGADKGRVTVSLYPTRKHKDVDTRQVGEIGVNSARGPQAVCADISKRLVNKPDALIKLQENDKRVIEAEARDKRLMSHLDALKKACPNVSIAAHHPPSGGSVQLFSHGKGIYFNARLYSNGDVGFDRLGNVSQDQARRIFAILAEG